MDCSHPSRFNFAKSPPTIKESGRGGHLSSRDESVCFFSNCVLRCFAPTTLSLSHPDVFCFHNFIISTKASAGTSTLEISRSFFFPSFCRSSSFFFRNGSDECPWAKIFYPMTSRRSALMRSFAITLPPITIWTDTSNCCAGMREDNFWTNCLAKAWLELLMHTSDKASHASPFNRVTTLKSLFFRFSVRLGFKFFYYNHSFWRGIDKSHT